MLLIEVIASLAHNVFHAVKETALLAGSVLVFLCFVFHEVLSAVDGFFNDIAGLGDLVLQVIEVIAFIICHILLRLLWCGADVFFLGLAHHML